MKRKVFSFAMMFLLAFMPMSIFAYSGSGTSSNPYLIQNVSDWNTFAAEVAGGQTYSGVYFKLMTNISVTTMAGSFERPFAGTFDGNNHGYGRQMCFVPPRHESDDQKPESHWNH